MKTFYRKEDGYTYFLANKTLIACPTFEDGGLDFEFWLPVEDFAEPLQESEIKEIMDALNGYDIEKDHANIKKQIKEWEKTIDHVIRSIRNDGGCGVIDDLEGITQEMMSINI